MDVPKKLAGKMAEAETDRSYKEELETNTKCWDYLKKPQRAEVKVKERRGWETIRIFVSSTFKDFNFERDFLVKKVFPDLRKWCQSRKLHLMECDLRWGVPEHYQSQDTFKVCLEELERCYQDNGCPFFLNMTSQRIGWIPKKNAKEEKDRIEESLLTKYDLVFGLSITEMEIVYGAYRIENPNGLFLIREDSFYDTLPKDGSEKSKKALDAFKYDDFAKEKLPILRQKIHEVFEENQNVPERRVIRYRATFKEFNNDNKVVLDIDDEEEVTMKIRKFFEKQISLMYPPPEKLTDKFKEIQSQHSAFMEMKARDVIGRDEILKKISSYVTSVNTDSPMLVLGGPGTGKSCIMAKGALNIKETNSKGRQCYQVFHHFVGAVPGSTEVLVMLQRLLRELRSIPEDELPGDVESAIQMTYSALSQSSKQTTVVFIDALNQFDDDHPLVPLVNWLPKKLPKSLKCIFSLIPETPQHLHLKARTVTPQEVVVAGLKEPDKKTIISNFFKSYAKVLDDEQEKLLLQKTCSSNPLWLTIACEELRIHGNFRNVKEKFKTLKDDLLELIEDVFDRFETDSGDSGRDYLKSTLCLIEVSRHGLLESELFYLLGDSDLLPRSTDEKGQHEAKEKPKYKDEDRLPAYHWSLVSRSLGPFLRPFGELGEGRLDFYHRAVSKAVRRKYLQDGDSKRTKANYQWWHTKIADYFKYSDHAKEEEALTRRVQEYPYHLVELEDTQSLREFLDDWQTFDKLYDREHSLTLLSYWQKCGGYDKMTECYSTKLEKLSTTNEKIQRHEQVGRVAMQSGNYSDALSLAESGLKTTERLGKDKSQFAGYYMLLSDLHYTKYREVKQLGADNIPLVKEALKYGEKCVDVLKQLSEKTAEMHYKKLYGVYLTRHASSHASLSDNLKYLMEPEEATEQRFTPEKAVETGRKMIEQAIKLFEKLKDKGLLAEAKLTKGRLYRRKFQPQIQCLKEAAELCKEAFGETHLLMARILNSMGTAYVEHTDFKDGYEHYVKSYEVYWEICGSDHPQTKKALSVIQDKFYVDRFGKYEGKK